LLSAFELLLPPKNSGYFQSVHLYQRTQKVGTCQHILMKYFGVVEHGPRTKQLQGVAKNRPLKFFAVFSATKRKWRKTLGSTFLQHPVDFG